MRRYRLRCGNITRCPSKTEDGKPIKKLYVSNLPPKTTRTELLEMFSKFGAISSCWLRMWDEDLNKISSPTYAFITFCCADDAHAVLRERKYRKMLRGRQLKIAPAESWHQPDQSSYKILPSTIKRFSELKIGTRSAKADQKTAQGPACGPVTYTQLDPDTAKTNEEQTIKDTGINSTEIHNLLDILNFDCLSHILDYVSISDLIRSERVSKGWQNMILEYLQSLRLLKTSRICKRKMLTTAILRQVLLQMGGSLVRLHVDRGGESLNNRTAYVIAKLCPNLEELSVLQMTTKCWKPLKNGCKYLKKLSFVMCSQLSDSSLTPLMEKQSCLESLAISNCPDVQGQFLIRTNPMKLSSLKWDNFTVWDTDLLSKAIDTSTLPNLIVLHLDENYSNSFSGEGKWTVILQILIKLRKLQELSLNHHRNALTGNNDFCKAISSLTELKILSLERNYNVNNAVLKVVAQTCSKLESLNISGCSSTSYGTKTGVSDEGVVALCSGCPLLSRLDVSYLAALSDVGLRAATRLSRLETLTARGIPALSASPFSAIVTACPLLKTGVSDEGVVALCSGCPLLSRLDVSYLAALSDAGLRAATRLSRLETLTARGIPALSASPFSAIVTACPLLKKLDARECSAVCGEVVVSANVALLMHPRALTLYLGNTAAACVDSAQEYDTHKLLTINFDPEGSKGFEDCLSNIRGAGSSDRFILSLIPSRPIC